jgi:hypothetical protein
MYAVGGLLGLLGGAVLIPALRRERGRASSPAIAQAEALVDAALEPVR